MARRLPKTDDQRVEFVPNFRPFISPIPIPTVGICDAPAYGVCINAQWWSIIRGLLHTLDQPDVWESEDPDDIFAVRQEVREVASMSGCLCGYPPGIWVTNIAVNRTLNLQLNEIFEDGGLPAVAPDLPDTSYSEDTGDTGNEVARRRVALCWAVHDYVATIVEQGIFNAFISDTTTLLATGAISFFLGPLGGLVYAVGSNVMETLINLVADDPDLITAVSCCMYDNLLEADLTQANFESSLDGCGFGALSDEAFVADAIRSGLDNQGNWLSFMAMLGSFMNVTDETSNCICPVDPGCLSDFTIDNGDWHAVLASAIYSAGIGWAPSTSGGNNHRIIIGYTHTEDFTLTKVRVTCTNDDDENWQWRLATRDEFDVVIDNILIELPTGTTEHTFVLSGATNIRDVRARVDAVEGLQDRIEGHIVKIEILDGDCVLPEQPV